eukprot:Sdes_comp19091_c0_seq1m9739
MFPLKRNFSLEKLSPLDLSGSATTYHNPDLKGTLAPENKFLFDTPCLQPHSSPSLLLTPPLVNTDKSILDNVFFPQSQVNSSMPSSLSYPDISIPSSNPNSVMPLLSDDILGQRTLGNLSLLHRNSTEYQRAFSVEANLNFKHEKNWVFEGKGKYFQSLVVLDFAEQVSGWSFHIIFPDTIKVVAISKNMKYISGIQTGYILLQPSPENIQKSNGDIFCIRFFGTYTSEEPPHPLYMDIFHEQSYFSPHLAEGNLSELPILFDDSSSKPEGIDHQRVYHEQEIVEKIKTFQDTLQLSTQVSPPISKEYLDPSFSIVSDFSDDFKSIFSVNNQSCDDSSLSECNSTGQNNSQLEWKCVQILPNSYDNFQIANSPKQSKRSPRGCTGKQPVTTTPNSTACDSSDTPLMKIKRKASKDLSLEINPFPDLLKPLVKSPRSSLHTSDSLLSPRAEIAAILESISLESALDFDKFTELPFNI